jgi:Secretion system C-terminal sorting domain
MKKNILLLIIIMHYSIFSMAQLTWLKTKEGISFDVVQLKKDSNYLLPITINTANSTSTTIIKFDNFGNITSNYSLIEPDNDISLDAGIIEFNNKLYCAGGLSESGQWYSNTYIKATNEIGDNFWHQDLGDSVNFNAATKIKWQNNNLHILAFKNIDDIKSTLNFIKLDTNGTIIFNKDIIDSTLQYNEGKDFTILPDSSYFIIGYCKSNLYGNIPYLIRLNSQGDTIFTKKIYPPNNLEGQFLFSCISANDSNIIAVGRKYMYILDSVGLFQYKEFNYFVKFDNMGNLIFEKTYTSSNLACSFTNIANTSDGNFITCGNYNSNGLVDNNKILVSKFDDLGNELWSKKFTTSIYGNGAFKIIQTFDNGYLILGFAKNSDTNYNNSVLLIKLDSLGNNIFATKINPITNEIEKINIYPNPTNGIIHILNPNHTKFTSIQFYSLNGTLLQTYNGMDAEINISEFANGEYLIKLNTTKEYFTQKIIKN